MLEYILTSKASPIIHSHYTTLRTIVSRFLIQVHLVLVAKQRGIQVTTSSLRRSLFLPLFARRNSGVRRARRLSAVVVINPPE
eukprot:m.21183 g.21183  ORF g.21183 m.21183 type:complete len:83 (-) comp3866_c0_seq1:1779-2027(-)